MSTPVNLNKVRKTRARAAKRAQADKNVVKHGRSKVEKQQDKAKANKAATFIDAHKREP